MPNASKNKGSNEERAVVNTMRDAGFICKRTLEAGARPDGSPTYDIDLFYRGPNQDALRGECKIRKAGLKFIYDSLGQNDFLTYRINNQKRLYILSEETLLRLLKEAGE